MRCVFIEDILCRMYCLLMVCVYNMMVSVDRVCVYNMMVSVDRVCVYNMIGMCVYTSVPFKMQLHAYFMHV